MDVNEHGFFRELVILVSIYITHKLENRFLTALMARAEIEGATTMQLTKAWDLKELAAALKQDGLDISEEAARALLEKSFDFIEQSVKLTPTALDDMALVVLPAVKPYVMAAIDKINGKADQQAAQ